MKIFKIFHFFLLTTLPIIIYPKCIVSQNYCNKCNPLTDLCALCTKLDVLIPDEKGGCIGTKKCIVGKNYCFECETNNELCKKCDEGLYPDENGGCSYTNFCKISYNGECLECIDDFILVGEEYNYKFCKSKISDDFLNCEEIDNKKGGCQKCKEGFYLNVGDRKCIEIENCYESIFGNCVKCMPGFYYNKKLNKCIQKKGDLIFCKQTMDEEKCDICDDYHYFDENGICTFGNFCSESKNGKCIKCMDGYYLTNDNICSITNNCYYSDKDTGICLVCDTHFYLDTKDYKCKTNLEDNNFKYCQKVENNECTTCEWRYELGSDSKCSTTKFCEESENGICNLCIENYYLGLDNNCIDIKNCIYSQNNQCIQCKKGLYYNKKTNKCQEQDSEIFNNCKYSNEGGNLCAECEDNFYLRKNDSLCFSNEEKNDLYKCAYSDNGEICEQCIQGYYLGREDKRCSLIEDCAISEDENNCIKCGTLYCLDVKKQKCVDNDKIFDENIKYYFKCNKTNEEGNKCEECNEGFEVGEDGYCVNVDNCEEEEEGICTKCKTLNSYIGLCANKIFGCVETVYKQCLRCDDYMNFNNCTECKEGYVKTFYGGCEIEKKN